MCEKAMHRKPFSLEFVPDCFKTKQMCREAVEIGLQSLVYVPDSYKTQELFNEAVDVGPLSLGFAPDQYKTREMCDKVVTHDPYTLQYVPDQFVTQQQAKIQYDDVNPYNDDKLTGCLLKTQGQESKNRRRVNAYCLAPIRMVGLVHVRRREKKRQKNCGSSCF